MMRHKFKFVLFIVIVGFSKISFGNSETSVDSDISFGYEILQYRLDYLQNSQSKMSEELTEVKDSTKLMLEKHNSLLERLLDGVLTIANNSNQQISHVHKDCRYAKTSGLFQILCDFCPTPVTVYCEMDSFGGGWLVVQQRLDGSVNFTRNWEEYKNGFGVIGKSTEFWLGLEILHQITTSGDFELMIEVKDKDKGFGYAHYSNFMILGENEKYNMSRLGKHTGTIKDQLKTQKGLKFSTLHYDSCIDRNLGGWWYTNCGRVDLNGQYNVKNHQFGIYWVGWTSKAIFSRMMIRRN